MPVEKRMALFCSPPAVSLPLKLPPLHPNFFGKAGWVEIECKQKACHPLLIGGRNWRESIYERMSVTQCFSCDRGNLLAAWRMASAWRI